MVDIFLGIVEQGFIYGIMALGVYITYRILDFPDLSVDGSFPLGAAVVAALIVQGVNPWLTLIAALAFGVLAGLVTGIIHVYFHVRDLLAGIITMTGLYTVNMRIAGSANVPLFNNDTIFTSGPVTLLPESLQPYNTLIVATLLMLFCKILLDAYFKTQNGFLLIAVGDNARVVTGLARNEGRMKILGLMISNGLVAFSGGILAQQQRFFEVSMGTGTIVVGLAAVIIGMNLFHGNILLGTTTAIIGSVLYKACVAGAIALGFETTDMKLMTALLFLAVLTIHRRDKRPGIKQKEGAIDD